MSERYNRWYSEDEVKAVLEGRAKGLTYRQIAYPLGRRWWHLWTPRRRQLPTALDEGFQCP